MTPDRTVRGHYLLETPASFFGINEVEAVLITAAVAAIIAIWAIFSQRALVARQTTIEFIRNSEADRDMINARAVFNEASRHKNGVGKWATKPLSDEFKSIRMVLNEYELVAIAIQRGIFDDATYRRWHRSGVIQTWDHAAPFILTRRKNANNSALWHEFEEMARWYRGGPKMPRRRFLWRKFV